MIELYTCETCDGMFTYSEGLLYDWIKPQPMFECSKCYDARIDEYYAELQDQHSLVCDL